MALPVPPLPLSLSGRGAQGWRAIVAAPATALIAFDIDGTLAPIVDDPAAVRPQPGAPQALRRLAAVVGTVAVVTGRPAPIAAALLGFDTAPAPANLLVVGHYGLEQWTPPAGVVRLIGVDEWLIAQGRIEAVRAELPSVLHGAPTGTMVEDKGASVAVHVRQTSDPVAAMELLQPRLAALAAAHGVRLEPGRLVLELRPAVIDKGVAVQRLVDHAGARAVAYVGDDLGDLAAFDALDTLARRGAAVIAVCSKARDIAAVPALAARADLVLDGAPAVVGFVDRLVSAITGRGIEAI